MKNKKVLQDLGVTSKSKQNFKLISWKVCITICRCVGIWSCFLYLGYFPIFRYNLIRIARQLTLWDLFSTGWRFSEQPSQVVLYTLSPARAAHSLSSRGAPGFMSAIIFNAHKSPARYTTVSLCAHTRLVRVGIWTQISLPSEPKAFLFLHSVCRGGVRSPASCPPHVVADAREFSYAVPGKILVCQAQPSGSWVWCSLGIPLSFFRKTQWKIPSMIFIIQFLFIERYLTKSKLRNIFSLRGRYVFFLLSVCKKKKKKYNLHFPFCPGCQDA